MLSPFVVDTANGRRSKPASNPFPRGLVGIHSIKERVRKWRQEWGAEFWGEEAGALAAKGKEVGKERKGFGFVSLWRYRRSSGMIGPKHAQD